MGIFDFLKRSNYKGHVIEPTERELGGSVTRAKHEITALKLELEKEKLRLEAERDRIRLQTEIEHYQQQLDDLIGEEEEPESGGSPEDAILGAFLSKIMANQQPAPQIQQPAPRPAADPEEIQFKRVWDSLSPQHKKTALKMSDGQLKAIVGANLLDLDEAGLDRAVLFVRKQKV